MRVLAACVMVLALVAAIVPQLTNCEAQGGTMPGSTTAAVSGAATSSGGTAAVATTPKPKMKCLWTARAGIGAAIPLFAAGALLFFSRRREPRRALAVVITLLGLVIILLPIALIGTCASSDAVCNTTMSPAMLLTGGLVVALGLAVLAANEMIRREPAGAQATA